MVPAPQRPSTGTGAVRVTSTTSPPSTVRAVADHVHAAKGRRRKFRRPCRAVGRSHVARGHQRERPSDAEDSMMFRTWRVRVSWNRPDGEHHEQRADEHKVDDGAARVVSRR